MREKRVGHNCKMGKKCVNAAETELGNAENI